MFRTVGKTTQALPSAIYGVGCDNSGLYFMTLRVVTDDLIILPDSANERIVAAMDKFWGREEIYKKRGMLFKRGLLLWGPPGGGKTATLNLLCEQLVKAGGMVLMVRQPQLASIALAELRRIEPDRKLICILEDIEEIIVAYGEHDLLALLDGENQVSNVVMLATTNFPENLGARIVNRPSRFDERIFVDMPSASAREAYLRKVVPEVSGDDLTRWVVDTKGLSIAHLRELAAAVFCLDHRYDEALDRLKSMKMQLDGVGNALRRQAKQGFNVGQEMIETAAGATR